MRRRLRGAVGAAVLAGALLAGCADALEDEAQDQAERQTSGATTAGAPAKAEPASDPSAPKPEPAVCPAALAGCRTAEGEILYVEAVDPDGDGDAHFVLISEQSITGPGISVIDVRSDLRPDPLPDVGDRVSAAGPVFPGSHGQRQIEAVVVHTAYTQAQ